MGHVRTLLKLAKGACQVSPLSSSFSKVLLFPLLHAFKCVKQIHGDDG